MARCTAFRLQVSTVPTLSSDVEHVTPALPQRVGPEWPEALLTLPGMTSRSLLALVTRAFLTASFPILFTTGNPAHHWSLILCLFWGQKYGTLLGLDSKAKISPKIDPTRCVAIVMARLVVLVSGLSLASPIPDPRNGKHPCCSDCTCLLTCFPQKYTSMLLLCEPSTPLAKSDVPPGMQLISSRREHD